MTEPRIKKPSKKTSHFPKSAKHAPQAEQTQDTTVTTAQKTAKKSAKPPAVAAKTPAKTSARPATTATKATTKSATKSATKAATEAATKTSDSKARRSKKEKVVRDSFTMPKSDYDKIAALKQKCLTEGVSVKKSEILRAGLLLLEAASEKRLLAAVAAVEQVKTGRPAKA